MDALSTDLLIIGLGPAGASAAMQGAAKGLSVLAIDRKSEPGVPVQCAEYLPTIGAGLNWRDYYVQSISALQSHFAAGDTSTQRAPGMMLDRAALDASLVSRARADGADIRMGCKLRAIDVSKSQALIDQAGKSFVVGFRCLLAADGPVSKVGRLLGLKALSCINSRQYTVALKRPLSECHVWLAPEYGSGYAWLFPKGQKANLGVGAGELRICRLKEMLDRLLYEQCSAGMLHNRVINSTGGKIPVTGMRGRLYVKQGNTRVIFAGDAAGLTHPISGAGIAQAMYSGQLAAGQVCAHVLGEEKSAFDEYECELRDVFGSTIERAVAKRRQWQQAVAEKQCTVSLLKSSWVGAGEYFQ